ncbi:MAG: zinc-dependent metalloprotease [Flavobacteriaceae bacterium]
MKDYKMQNKFFTSLLFVFVSLSIFSQENYWKSGVTTSKKNTFFNDLHQNSYQTSTLNVNLFKTKLESFTLRKSAVRQSDVVILLPNNDGGLEKFKVQEVAIFSPVLASQYPDIKAYIAYGIDTPGARARFTVSPQGLQSMISYPNQQHVFTVPIEKGDDQNYITYTRASRKNNLKKLECLTEAVTPEAEIDSFNERAANDQTLRTFRIAISASGEYTDFWNDGDNSNGDARADALAQIVSTLNRVNEIYEVDMAITFQLVSGTNTIFSDATTDPYSGEFIDLTGQVQDELENTIGNANFDVGHLFHFGSDSSSLGNGLACGSCVCVDGQKGRAASAHIFEGENGSPYMSDYFDIDYVSHEIGHQMGANHTWSHRGENFGVNVEPGSGTTIMGYAGITDEDDVQNHSDPYFNYHSIRQILRRVETRTCWTSTNITNNSPVANAGADYTIPAGTPFLLNGEGTTDADNSDVLTYTWEQIDNGVINFDNFGPTKTTGAMFRSRTPATSPNRYMPVLSRILSDQLTETNPVKNNDNTSWETLSSVSRDLTFALTVRDRSEANGVGQFPQSSYDVMTVTVDDSAGPFEVTSQTTSEVWEKCSIQNITWNVANTDRGNVNARNVNIRLSVDGGFTYPFLLVENTLNDGSYNAVVPDVGGAVNTARIMIEGSDNIFFAVNAADFTVQNSGNITGECPSFAEFEMYPNPSNGSFILNLDLNNPEVKIRVFDLKGALIKTLNYANAGSRFSETVVLGDISKGLYIIQVSNGGNSYMRKIVIE